jgi:glycerol-3-phosphate acyltransferase PlsY
MSELYYGLLILAAYLIGSVPSSIWVGKLFFHLDIREHGSGNAGAANTFRVLGWKAGVTVLLFDVFKGWLAVRLARFAGLVPGPSEALMTQQLILGTAAAVGHIFPVYARFKGGKGVATFLGVALALAPGATLISIATFIIIVLLFNYISLASMSAGAMFPVSVWLILPSPWLSLKVFAVAVALLLIWTHRSNIRRIIRGEESKASDLFRKKEKKTT